MIRAALAAAGVGTLAIPAIAVLATLSLGASNLACLDTSLAYGPLADDALVTTETRTRAAGITATCPALPEAWVAALLTHHPVDPAEASGTRLCADLQDVQAQQATHPAWAASRLPVLDALVLALTDRPEGLSENPAIPETTARLITTIDTSATAWSSVHTLDGPDTTTPAEPLIAPVPADSYPLRTAGTGCLPSLGTAHAVTVPPGTPHDVATAVTTALSYVGVTSGWDGLCDRLACRAYGYANAGYFSAATHWAAMNAQGHAHPGDRCPPLGSFAFFRSGAHTYGHVSVVVQASPTCDPEQTLVTSNGVFDRATGNHGGVYLLSFARLSGMYLDGNGYLGWSNPVCAGDPLPPGTIHPTASRP